MHENENLDPGMIFSPHKCSWVVGLYTTLCMEFHGNFIFMHFHEMFIPQSFHA